MAELAESHGGRYPHYKLTGVEWLPEIPVGWEVKRFKFVADVQKGRIPSELFSEQVADTLLPYLAMDYLRGAPKQLWFAERNDSAVYIQDGELLLLWDGSNAGEFIIGKEGILSSTTGLIRLRLEVDESYFQHYAKFFERILKEGTIGMGIPHVNPAILANAIVPLPPFKEQRAIARFLDDKTAQLDQLIAQKQQMLELLREERAALINHAVTKGLDAAAPLRDSGVEWLGEVSAHWEVKRLKHLLVKLEQGWSPSCESREAEPSEWGVLKVGCVNGLHFNASENKALPSELAPMPEYEISKGDFLISRANTKELVGSASIVGEVRPNLLLCDKLFRLFFNSVANKEFVLLIISSGYGRFQIQSECSGASSSMQNISQEFLKNMLILLPDRYEQQAIVEYVAKQTSRILETTDTINQEIALLQEYRAALIAEAVTGQLDVRHYVPAAAAILM